jgi:TolA-binding protein
MARERRGRDTEREAVTRWRCALVAALVISLVACAGPSKSKVEAPEPAPAPAPPAPRPAATPSTPEPPKQADQLARIASELVELQNAVAKLMMSARQHDDQLVYLQRRLVDLENQARGRGPAATLPPSAAMPTPLPPMALPPPPTAVAPPPSSPSAAPAPSPRGLPSAPRAPTAPVAPASPAEELYRAGLEKYQSGDLDGAVVTLYEVVANFPTDPAREPAQFLVGDIFLAQKDYRGAIAEFEGLITAVPRGGRTADALLKIGLAQRSLGEEARARRTWERLVKDFPTSGAARQARTLLKGRG